MANTSHPDTPSVATAAPTNAVMFECCVCCEEYLEDDFELHCWEHPMCNTCIRQVFELALHDTSAFPASCCGARHRISIRLFQDILDPDLVKAYRQKIQEHDVPETVRVYCSNGTCSVFLPRAQFEEKSYSTTARCSSCDFITCVGCKSVWEGYDHECDFENSGTRPPAYSPDCRIKKCPYCRQFIEHAGACNHMTCKCGREWCFVCLEDWSTASSDNEHNCPLYNDPEYDEEEFEIEARGLNRDTGLDREEYNRRGYNQYGEHRAASAALDNNGFVEDRPPWVDVAHEEEDIRHDKDEDNFDDRQYDLNEGADHNLDRDGDYDGFMENDADVLEAAIPEADADDLDEAQHQNLEPEPPRPQTPPYQPVPQSLPPFSQINCDHQWVYRPGGGSCSLCRWYADRFTNNCSTCAAQVCRSCSYNYLGNLEYNAPGESGMTIDLLDRRAEIEYSEKHPFEPLRIGHYEDVGYDIDRLHERYEAGFNERHPFLYEDFGTEALYGRADEAYDAGNPRAIVSQMDRGFEIVHGDPTAFEYLDLDVEC
ncbi:hypothetical protein LTS18_009839 [Coniosporium uncinatum]|uniref:Uncharacterized protein n=1 Tax=Coniosporium uncinatum TaxID=93489 RepID=A0ACC3DZH8_9PEZI|nr:hypothetical protein LTS18_009839 [Coniosporium uncinatum]